ncbi:hypothetical protein LXA43DRAFT_1022802 [Ganoderma leucocontextum]|nr:hypothetical protein LXA43DRAFT_1022802 [Ganoderma leucocontextum]
MHSPWHVGNFWLLNMSFKFLSCLCHPLCPQRNGMDTLSGAQISQRYPHLNHQALPVMLLCILKTHCTVICISEGPMHGMHRIGGDVTGRWMWQIRSRSGRKGSRPFGGYWRQRRLDGARQIPNLYVVTEHIPDCGRQPERHIGPAIYKKSSTGAESRQD